jgi:putative transposase
VPHAPVLRVGVFPMPKGLKRYYGLGHLHFLTFSCYRRLPLLNTVRARNVFVNALEEIRERHGALVAGYVVMPEHVHLLIGEPSKGSLSMVLQTLKQRVSRDLRKAGRDGNLQRFWQARFYDFNVHSAAKRREKLDYMHANPVKRGLVESPAQWAWSSWSFYATGKMGAVRIDSVE